MLVLLLILCLMILLIMEHMLQSLCIDSSNNLYVNDYVSGTNTIYKINTTNSNVYKLYGGGAYGPTNNSD